MATTIIERIYIGGLDPPRLTASDILHRLNSVEDVEIQSIIIAGDGDDNVDHHRLDSRPYVHIYARSKHAGTSALEVISKQYNNVKWKGCKLAVEAAKPHFLERLEEERRERAAIINPGGIINDENNTKEENSTTKSNHPEANSLTQDHSQSADQQPSALPRRLRVRKKFGEEAFHIDTKPWTVGSWSDFVLARTKALQRVEKFRQGGTKFNESTAAQKQAIAQNKKVRPQKMMHQSIHIRFPLDEHRGHAQNGVLNRDGDRSQSPSRDPSESHSSTSSDESVSTSSSAADDAPHKSPPQPENAYQWSSSEDEGDAGDHHRHHPDETSFDQGDVGLSDGESVADNSETSKPQDQQNDPAPDFVAVSRDPPTTSNTNYSWSSDEDSSDRERHSQKTKVMRPLIEKPSAADEFASGIQDISETDEESTEDHDDDENYRNEDREYSSQLNDLKDDVGTNLGILSSLFPDMNSMQPVDVQDPMDDHKNSTGIKPLPEPGIMPRFDPTLKSSKKYELDDSDLPDRTSLTEDEDKHLTDEGSKDETSSDKKVSEENVVCDINNEKQESPVSITDDPKPIYEQDKLETVFRDARTAWNQQTEKQAPVTESSKTAEEEPSSGGFAFGFALDEAKQDTGSDVKQTTAGFSFSFGLLSSTGEPSVDANTDRHDDKMNEENVPATKADSGSPEEEATSRLPIRRGFSFPKEDLLKYADAFFSLNNGQHILQNPEGFRNDPKEREAWNQERQTLTLDWKRKRKYAMSRIHKRLRS